MNRSMTALLILAIGAGTFLVAGLDGFFNRGKPNTQQVPLPDIAGQFFTTVIYDDSPESNKLLSFFENDPVLNVIKNRERHNEIASTDPYYVENFKPRLKEGDNFPIFLIQRPNGDSCLILSRDTMPDTSQELAGFIRRRCEPRIPPSPKKPIKEKIKEIALVVDSVKNIVPTGGNIASIIALIISALGAGGLAVRDFKGQGL